MTENRSVMIRWRRESMAALEQLRRERDHYERALEAAMEAIRVHTQTIDALERDIDVIEKAMASTEDVPSATVARPIEAELEAELEDELEVSLPTMVHAAVVPPRPPPPLRPVRPLPRATG